jgi:hypothetical protein
MKILGLNSNRGWVCSVVQNIYGGFGYKVTGVWRWPLRMRGSLLLWLRTWKLFNECLRNGEGSRLPWLYDPASIIYAKAFIVTVPAVFFLLPTYLGLVLFTGVSCQKAGTSLVSNAFLFLRLCPRPHLQASREMTYNSLYTALWRGEIQRFISCCYLFCYIFRILDYNLQGTDKFYQSPSVLYHSPE